MMGYDSVLSSYEAMKRCRRNFNADYKGKEANLKRLCTGRFQVYDILEKENLW